MQFDTKIAVAIRTDLETWQKKLNVASFLTGGIAAAFPECIGDAYEDGSGTCYLALIGQPILIYGADRAALSRALERALARNVTPALYTEDMFATTHDAANRAAGQGGRAYRPQSRRARAARRAQGGRQDPRWAEIPQLACDEVEAELDFAVIARSASDDAIQGVVCGPGLLRFARNDGAGDTDLN